MGIRLVVEVLDYAPADLTPAERLVLVVIAEQANDQTRLGYGQVLSLEFIARRTGIKPKSLSELFRRLARREPPLEVRVAVGVGKDGRAVFAHEGTRTTYRVPILRPHHSGPSAASGPTTNGPLSGEAPPPVGHSEPEAPPQPPTGPTTVAESPHHGGALPLSTPSAPQEELRADVRSDVEQVCKHLADRVEGHGSKRPTITKQWRTAARLLIDSDGRTAAQIIRAIDWCQDDDFWHRNILSMPKLREKYDQLRLQAKPRRSASTNDRVADAVAAADRLQAQYDQRELTA